MPPPEPKCGQRARRRREAQRDAPKLLDARRRRNRRLAFPLRGSPEPGSARGACACGASACGAEPAREGRACPADSARLRPARRAHRACPGARGLGHRPFERAEPACRQRRAVQQPLVRDASRVTRAVVGCADTYAGPQPCRTGYAYRSPAYRTYLRHRAAGAPRHVRLTRTSLGRAVSTQSTRIVALQVVG